MSGWLVVANIMMPGKLQILVARAQFALGLRIAIHAVSFRAFEAIKRWTNYLNSVKGAA